MKCRGLTILCSIWLCLIITALGTAEINLDDFAGVWLFDEGKGNVVGDFTENGNDGEFDGPKWIDGKFGKAWNSTEVRSLSLLSITISSTLRVMISPWDAG